MKHNFDAAGFYAALERAVNARSVTWSHVAGQTGVSGTTLSRMKEGRKPDAASMAALALWAGLNAADFVTRPEPRGESIPCPVRLKRMGRPPIDKTARDRERRRIVLHEGMLACYQVIDTCRQELAELDAADKAIRTTP